MGALVSRANVMIFASTAIPSRPPRHMLFERELDAYSTEFSTKCRGNVQENLVEKFLLTSTSVAVYSPSAFVTGLRKWMRSGETSS